jgi:hypothetical protein
MTKQAINMLQVIINKLVIAQRDDGCGRFGLRDAGWFCYHLV